MHAKKMMLIVFFIQDPCGFICTTNKKWTIELQNSPLVP